MSAQDFGSGVNLSSNHGFKRCNPVLEKVNLGDLGKMAGLEICRTAMVEAGVLEFVQCSNLALCCGKAYLLLGCVILPMSSFISGVPFILTFLPYQTDEIAGPSYSVIRVGWIKGLEMYCSNIQRIKINFKGCNAFSMTVNNCWRWQFTFQQIQRHLDSPLVTEKALGCSSFISINSEPFSSFAPNKSTKLFCMELHASL
jgi:hypothetical protein